MYTTDRAEQALDDIRKVFLLYERGIIKDSQVRDLTYKIVDLYVTDTVVPKTTGQSCNTCLFFKHNICYAKKITVDSNAFCDSWQEGFKSDNTKE